MTRPKPPRVLNYDPEFGYVVAGTHDLDVAKALLAEHVAGFLRKGDDPAEYVASLPAPRLILGRCTQDARCGRDWRWILGYADKRGPGVFPAVEWSR